MSDPKRANLITVGAPKSAKKIVNKTVRLTINLVESNESKYPELNYKELVIAEEKKKRIENGKTGGLDPFSDNDDDVERVAKKFEQKYGNNSTYGKKKKRSKNDDFADIGAGYDENDSFIDNTHGYDEMIPPDIDTFLGGFYINCGSLEFKNLPHDQSGAADDQRRNKRRISSSSSEEESSESSSDSESQDTKEPKAVVNGAIDSHKTEHRKKKNKKIDKQKAKKVRRVDSSAATSGKQTSDDNIHPDGEGESVDSRTSHSDSLTSKPAPSSENAITSDSSRDTESKTDVQLPPAVTQVLDGLEASISKHLIEHPATPASTLMAINDSHIQRLEVALRKCDAVTCRAAGLRAARSLGVPRSRLARLGGGDAVPQTTSENAQPSTNTATTTATTTAPATTTAIATATVVPAAATVATSKNKRKLVEEDEIDISTLSDDQREAMILDTIRRLMHLIEEFKPAMFANYNMECERVREEKKKLTSDGATVDKRLPKRRFPWCHRSRSLLYRITKLAGSQQAGAMLLAERVLPLFPKGFVRMPTLMRQANISKDIKVPEIKRQRLGSTTNQFPLTIHPPSLPQNIPPTIQTPPLFSEQIQFPSSLTVTATVMTSPDKPDTQTNKEVAHIVNSFSLSKDLKVEREKSDKKEDLYIPPNNIGSITITPVIQGQKEKKNEKQKTDSRTTIQKPTEKQTNVTQKVTEKQPSLIRVKSPAALNESVKKDAKTKKPDRVPEKTQPNPKDKRVDTPLQIETNFQATKKEPSPKNKEMSPRNKESVSQKQIESLRVKENNIPRPTLVPVHHSPTFAKPDRKPEAKKKDAEFKKKDVEMKKKDIMIVSDLDPLSDQEPVAVDDSSSDVEVIENDRSDTSEVPSKDNKVPKTKTEEAETDIDLLMRNIREMEHSQEPTKFNSNSFGGVVPSSNSNAKHGQQSFARNGMLMPRYNKDKFAERNSLNKTDGCNGVTG